MTIEFRHPSWHQPATYSLLEQYGVAYCIMSGAHLRCELQSTASFVYVRMHGPSRQHLYAGSYAEDDLIWWTQRITEWKQQGKEVYVYFNNDGAGNAVYNASRLQDLLNKVCQH